MGWHTLKRQKSAQKAAAAQATATQQKSSTPKAERRASHKHKNSSFKEKNIKNLTIRRPSPTHDSDVFTPVDEKVQTLLARATYDNHADAPDELSIRKGDIVTVIEKDIDGLTGWWLCLLHGQQGIVPGNRLQVIDPLQLVQMERKTTASKNRGSYETDDNSDGHDVADGIPPPVPASSNYDYLPNPVKTPGFVPQLSIKDMFDIPIKRSSLKQHGNDGEVVDGVTSQELYDVPTSSLNSTLDTSQQQDLYDIPSNRTSSNRNSANLSQSGYDSPRTGRKEYDGPTETYDVPANLTKRRTAPKQPAPYQVPSHKNSNETTSDDLYDVPKPKSRVASLDVDELMGEILDSPFNNDPAISTIKRRTPSNSNNSTPRGSYISNHSADTSQEIYDVPSNNQQQHVMNDSPRKNLHLQSPSTNSLSHTLPRGFSPRSKNNKNGTPVHSRKTPTRLQDIYNIPPQSNSSVITNNRSLPGSPPMSRKATAVSQEIYDVPAPRNNEPTSNPEFLSMLRQLELGGGGGGVSSNRSSFDSTHSNQNQQHIQDIYDIPTRPSSNRSSAGSGIGTSQYQNTHVGFRNHLQPHQQEIYDVPPPTHSRDGSAELYDVPPTSSTRNNADINKRHSGGRDLDPFTSPFQTSTPRDIDQQDIYDTPPPASLLRASNEKLASSSQQGGSATEIYDVPPSVMTGARNMYQPTGTQPQQDIYDVPATHNVDRVMEEAYLSHNRRNHNNNLLAVPGVGGDDDDYIDYYDIWSKEPPKDLLQQHPKTINAKERSNSRSPLGSSSPLSLSQKKRLSSGSETGSSGGKKSILDQINFEAVKELQLTVSQAAERLGKLHLAVDTCVQTLKMFHDDNWLEVTSLQTHIHSIRDFSGKLKTALRLLTEFGLGTLVNTTNNINGETLMDKIINDVEPLLESYYKIKICLMHLDSNNWVVPSSQDSKNEKFFATLNAIMILAQRIPDQCRAFTLAVKNNASELFTADSVVPSVVADVKKPQQPPQPKVQLLAEPVLSAGRRQQARDVTLRHVSPRIPPKPTLPNQRRSLAVSMDPSPLETLTPRYSLANRAGYGHIERLVTEYQPENTRQKKYASDPTTPSYTTANNTLWGGSCPVLLDRNSAGAAASSTLMMHNAESASSSSSVGASIPEETIEIKKTDLNAKTYTSSDSNLISPGLSPLHTRSASLPWDDKLKNVFSFEGSQQNKNSNNTMKSSGLKSPGISPLDHRDIESLEFFCRQVESQVLLLRESMKNLTESVENQEEPVVFVSHSKFIILTAHKVVHSGQEIGERLLHTTIKSKIKTHTAHLTVCIRGVVAATKTAALEYPDTTALMEMISSVLALGDAVRIIHTECRQALNA